MFLAELTRRSTNHTGQAIVFSFDYLWKLALNLNNTDPRSPSLFHPHDNQTRICLTYDACIRAVGADNVLYSQRDVYDRVILWRVPLIALVATTTLPTLGYHTQLFTILHLIASPIDTLWSLFYKLDLARRHRDWAEELGLSLVPVTPASPTSSNASQANSSSNVETLLPPSASHHAQQSREQTPSKAVSLSKSCRQYPLDGIALIVNAYEEWHFGEEARETILYHSKTNLTIKHREKFLRYCASAAACIAADRVARMLPSFVATLVFFTQLFAGFWKTLDNFDNRPREDLNRAPHNIAFGALYFWLPFAVLTTAFVGGAQTENSVPRILNRLRKDTKTLCSGQGESEEEQPSKKLPKLGFSMPERRIAGGLPTWQPDKFQGWKDEHMKFLAASLALSLLIVAIPSLAAIWVSWRTPTEGFGCRSLTQMCFFASWIISYGIDWLLSMVIRESPKEHGAVRSQWIYWITFIKDLILTIGAITMLTFTSVGIFNNCNCWTKWFPDHAGNQRYLSFPQEQLVFDTIKRRLNREFAIVTTVALGIELLTFFLVWLYFRRGHGVLKQRDIEDSSSQTGWRKTISGYFKGLFSSKPKKEKKVIIDVHSLVISMEPLQSQSSSLQHRQYTNTLESGPVRRATGFY